MIGVERIHAHDLALANRLRAGLGLAPSDSAILSFTADERAGGRLRAAGVRTSVRAGRMRISPHLYNGAADIDRALEALTGWRPPSADEPLQRPTRRSSPPVSGR